MTLCFIHNRVLPTRLQSNQKAKLKKTKGIKRGKTGQHIYNKEGGSVA